MYDTRKHQLMLLRQKIQILFTICSTYVSLFLHSYRYIDIGFSRVQRDSTPHFVHPSVCLPFHLSVAFYFFMISVADTRLYTLPCWLVGRSIGPFKVFLKLRAVFA